MIHRIDKIRDHVEDLSVALAHWAERDDSKAQPAVRRAATTAVESIDAMLLELYRLRSELMSQIRASDEASAARVDALLIGSATAVQHNKFISRSEPHRGRR